MLWFQTRHSKSPFLFPFLSRVWVLSRHIIGSTWFVFHWRALSKVQTVIYLGSHIPCLVRPSYQLSPHVKYQLCDRRTQTVAPVQESPRAGEMRKGGKTKRLDCLLLFFEHSNTDSTSENRGTNDISDDYPGSSESRIVNSFFEVASSLYLLGLTHPEHLAFGCSVQ